MKCEDCLNWDCCENCLDKEDTVNKEVENWTFDELLDYVRGYILISIGKGEFHSAVSLMVQLVLQWREKTK